MNGQIKDWYMLPNGRIRGVAVGQPSDRDGITTSRVISRDGNVVTTKSKSKYELILPAYFFHAGKHAANPFVAIDDFIAQQNKQDPITSG